MQNILTAESAPRGAGLRALLTSETSGGTKYSPLRLSSLMTAETTDTQLRELANKLCIRIDAIVFKSELSKLPRPSEHRNYNYVIHLEDPAHWTALFLDNRTHRAYYFNSFSNEFGGTPTDIIDFVKRSKAILYESDQPIQRSTTGYCGQYTMLWLRYINRPSNDIKDFNDYLELFEDTSDQIKKWKEKHGSNLNY